MAEEEKIYDLAIVGAGPAGLSAAINAKARSLDFILLGSDQYSLKVKQAPEVNNYLGFPEISGEDLAHNFARHVEKLDIEWEKLRVDNIYDQSSQFALMSNDRTINARSLVLAVGVSNEKTLPGEEELVGKGVSYCATCDGPLYRNKKVAGIVHTEEGVEDITYLADIAGEVYIITDLELKEELTTRVQMVEKSPQEIVGEDQVEGIKLADDSMLEVDGVFVFRKVTPPDKLMPGLEVVDNHLKVNRKMETTHKGVFAAGDCTGFPYQIAKAVGEGQIAALSAASYIQKLK